MCALKRYLPQYPTPRPESVDSVEIGMCLGRDFVLHLDRNAASVGSKVILVLSADLLRSQMLIRSLQKLQEQRETGPVVSIRKQSFRTQLIFTTLVILKIQRLTILVFLKKLI